jgi:hypothetical protein
MPITAEQVVEYYAERKKRQEPRFAVMRELDLAYAGELDVPLPEISRNEKPMVANLLQSGLDQTAMRVASTLPEPDFPPMRPGFDVHEDRARTKADIVLSWWAMNDLTLKLKERARHLIGYSTAPIRVGYDPTRPYPVWQVLDPFTTYLPPTSPTREMTPLDCIHTYTQPLRWLERLYPDHLAQLHKGHDSKPDTLFTCCEYLGYDETVLVILGEHRSDDVWQSPKGAGKPFIVADRIPNRAGICPVVAPYRIVLNRNKPMGQFDGLVGVFWWQAKLMALGGLAVERDIFPDEWAVARQGEVVEILEEADGLRGERGRLTGGDIKSIHESPGQQTMQMLNMLERAMRLEGGIPAEFGGESVSNVRTGRRGQQILSAAIDFAIQEAQQILEVSLREENVRAIAVDRAYYGNVPRSFYFDWKGRKGSGTYDPAETWDTDRHSVRYSFPGADLADLVISGGQRLGMKAMSRYRFMEIDPMIEDPELEHGRIVEESLEEAGLQGLQQGLVSGQIPPDDWAFIVSQIVEQRVPLYKAVMAAQQRAQERQASAGELGAPTGPVEPGAPEAQPGLAAPGAGAEVPTIGPPEAGMENLGQIMQTLRRTGRGAA